MVNDDIVAAVNFAKKATVATGFGYLDASGEIDESRPAELWITSRMTYVFALATLLGIDGAADYLRHGVSSLLSHFRDSEFGGWFNAIALTVGGDGRAEIVDGSKQAYAHAFVLLAANAAEAAADPEAPELLAAALESQTTHWYEPESGRVRESWDRAFETSEDYRGINANMHTVEAYLAYADLHNDAVMLDRAVGILQFVADQARAYQWRIPEHYDSQWKPVLDYHIDQPSDPFRPYGVTPGHGLEWARLMLQARESLQAQGAPVPEWMLPSARALYSRAVTDAWNVDGAPGFIYTTDFAGRPVTRQRMHWVLCEAIGAARVLKKTLEFQAAASDELETLERQISEWNDYASRYFVEAPGRWIHELDSSNEPDSTTWPGKPDLYHLLQMLLLVKLPVSPSFAAALCQRSYHRADESD